MAQRKVPLTGGYYEARWLGANAQRCLNWYPERNQDDAPFPFTDYPRPGLALLSNCPTPGYGRCLYTTSQGGFYAVVGNVLYKIDSSYNWTSVQTITTNTATPVSLADNGIVMILVDGSATGYAINLATGVSEQINDGGTGAFYGADRVDYVDTYFLFNRPQTNQFYISLSEVSQANLTGGPILTGSIVAAGTGYGNTTYYNVPLTGGTGSGATANLISAGGISNVAIISGGSNFVAGDHVSANIGGQILTGSLLYGGENYIDGTYNGVSLVNVGTTGGSGATANIVISGGTVTSITIANGGYGYVNGNGLTLDLTVFPGTGIYYEVLTVTTNGTGFSYLVQSVGSSGFDALDIAAKTGWPDNLITGPVVMHREVWLIGYRTTEVWYNSGASDFTFQALPGVFIEHGCIARWSIAPYDINIYWLSQDKQGRAIVVKGSNYTVTRISTHAIEDEIQSYSYLEDAVGFVYQVEGHVFYQLTFPTADKTWTWDESQQLWHEECWLDTDGVEHRVRPQVFASGYDLNLCLDWETGTLYQMSTDVYEDNGQPIKLLRSFPHLGAAGNRQFYYSFMLDIEAGTATGTLTSDPAQVTMRYSNDRGNTWGNPMLRGLGSAGQYNQYPIWYRCGYGRDRVFEVSTSANAVVSLNGGYIQTEEGSS